MDSTDRKRSRPNDEDSEAVQSQSKAVRLNGNDNETTVSISTNGQSSNGQQQQVETTNGIQAPVNKTLQNLADASKSTVKVDDEDQKRKHAKGKRGPKPSQAKVEAENEDFVKTIKPDFQKTVDIRQSKNTQVVKLMSNYFPMKNSASIPIYQYDVFFDSEALQGLTKTRCRLLREHASKLGPVYIFDGEAIMFLLQKLDVDSLELSSTHRKRDGEEIKEEKVKITCTFAKQVDPFDPVNIQVYNIIIRNCMKALDLCQLGRHYYDPAAHVVNGRARLEIWPGYKTSIRQHQRGLMLCVEMTNKVLRQDTVHDIIRKLGGDKKKIEKELIGITVMTVYNRKTYRIDEISFDKNPTTFTFPQKTKGMRRDDPGTEISLAAYMQERYGRTIKDGNQPILYSKAKKSEIRRGLAEKIALIPEFCQMTGLTDEQRADFNLMKDLNKTLQLSPTDRVKAVMKFSDRLHNKGVPSTVFQPLGLELERKLVNLDGRKYNSEQVNFGSGGNWTLGTGPRDRYDWMSKQQSGPMSSVKELKSWAVVAMDGKVDSFVKMIIDKARRMGFNMSSNYEREKVQRSGNQKQAFLNAIGQVMAKYGSTIQMILIFLPKKEEDLYAAIKRGCYYDYGIPSQCVLEKHVQCKPGKESAQSGVAVKVAVQISTKLGGVPWEVKVPVKGLMVIGFNISQTGQALGSNTRPAFGALVATTNDSLSQYYSTIVPYEEQARGEDSTTLSPKLGPKMAVILDAYKQKNNGALPSRIIFYRDGVGEGQLQCVVDVEIAAMEKSIKSVYEAINMDIPSFTFIVVNKRINTKFFVNAGQQCHNPGPGTCVDSVVTLPERYDFFLVSQTGTGQGTVSPTAYNVIQYTDGSAMKALAPNNLQWLTYKLCHLYYNWTSTVSVPSVCQYAAKLAFLQNLIKKESGRELRFDDITPALQHSLYFL